MTIQPRPEVDPDVGIEEYGDIAFADPVNNMFPIDNPEHILSAWRAIHDEEGAREYSALDLDCLERRIEDAARDMDISLGL
jgi:hypothetical protein